MINTVSKRDGYLVIWPQYFDATRSRKDGRRVSKFNSVPSPSAAEIALISRYVKLSPRLDEKAAHPSLPWDKCSRVLLRKPTIKGKRISKQRLLRILGKRLVLWYEKTTPKTRTAETKKLLERIERTE